MIKATRWKGTQKFFKLVVFKFLSCKTFSQKKKVNAKVKMCSYSEPCSGGGPRTQAAQVSFHLPTSWLWPLKHHPLSRRGDRRSERRGDFHRVATGEGKARSRIRPVFRRPVRFSFSHPTRPSGLTYEKEEEESKPLSWEKHPNGRLAGNEVWH